MYNSLEHVTCQMDKDTLARALSSTTSVCMRRPTCVPSSCVFADVWTITHARPPLPNSWSCSCLSVHPSTCFFFPGTISYYNKLEKKKLAPLECFACNLDVLAPLTTMALDFFYAIINIQLTITAIHLVISLSTSRHLWRN